MSSLFLKEIPTLVIKGKSKLRLTIFTPDGPDENEYIGIDFNTGEIVYPSGNFNNSEPDFENYFSYIIEPLDINDNSWIYNEDMFEGESFHENLSESEIKTIEDAIINDNQYVNIIRDSQKLVPDGGISLKI